MFTTLLKLAPLLIGQKQQQEERPYSRTFSQKDVALINIRQKIGAVIVIIGSRDTGKTELAYRLMEFLDKPAYAVSPQQKPPDWITWVKLENVMESVPSDSTLLCDDLPSYMSNRDYSEALVRMMEKMIPMVRHDPNPPDYPIGRVHLIFSTQSSAQADRYILDCDAAFFKPMGLLMGDIERPNIAKIYREFVNPEFDNKDDYFIQRHTYMMSRTFRGLIEVQKTT